MPAHTKMIICEDCGELKWNQSGTRCSKCYNNYRKRTEEPKPCSRCEKSHVLIKNGLCPSCYKKDWNKTNRDRVNEYNNEWNASHPERRKATLKRYYQTENGREVQSMNTHRRLARLNAAPGNGMNRKQWKAIKEISNYSCYYCGAKPKRLEVEHKTPLSRGGEHDISNIVPSCMKCNREKGTLTEEEFAHKRAG